MKLKRKAVLTAVMAAGWFCLTCGPGWSADRKTGTIDPDTVPLEVTEVRIKGVVTATDTGLTLVAGEKRYALKENGSLGRMVGKTVILDGIIQKDENGTLLVAYQAQAAK